MMGRPWDAAPPAHQQPAGLVSKCGAAYPGGPTHIITPPSKGGLVSSGSRDREGCSRTRPLKAKPCQVPDVTTTDTKPDIHHGCIPVGIAVARQRNQPYTPPLVGGEDGRCLSGAAGSQTGCTQQLGSGCSQQTLGCTQQTLGCSQQLGCAQALGCTVQQAATATQLACTSQPPSPWPLPPPHHHWPHSPYQGVEGCGLPPVGLQIHRDPMSGHLILLPNSVDNRGGVVWGGGPPLQVMAPTQPLLLGDRFVTLAHHDRRRPPSEHSPLAGVMVPCDFSKAATGGTAGGREISQQQLLIQHVPAGSQQVVLSSQLVEQSLGTSLVISNHQLSENTLTLSPHLVPVDAGFQPAATGLVISHTETNSFLRSDINTVFPVNGGPTIKEEIKPDITDSKNIIIPSPAQEVYSDPVEEKVEVSKSYVVDASNQTEISNVIGEEFTEKPQVHIIKEEKHEDEPHHQVVPQKEIKVEKEDVDDKSDEKSEDQNPRQIGESVIFEQSILEDDSHSEAVNKLQEGIDLSGLELLSNSIVQFECRMEEEVCKIKEPSQEIIPDKTDKKDSEGSMNEELKSKTEELEDSFLGGLDLLCKLAHQRFIEETQKENNIDENEEKNERDEKPIAPTAPPPPPAPPKKRPGRPKKNLNCVKGRELPPVLEPAWSSGSSWTSSSALSPPTLSPHKRKPSPPILEEEESIGNPTISSSKKRKVGRPRKRDDTPDQTETIVAKTNLMSSKAIVGLLLANQQNQSSTQHKIRPKLKAETIVKVWCDDDEDLNLGKLESSVISPKIKVPSYTSEVNEPLKKKLKVKNAPKITPAYTPGTASPKKNKSLEVSVVKDISSHSRSTKPIITTKAMLKEEPTFYKGERVESPNPFSNKIILKKEISPPTKDIKKLVPTSNKKTNREVSPVIKSEKLETPAVPPSKESPKKDIIVTPKEVVKKEVQIQPVKEVICSKHEETPPPLISNMETTKKEVSVIVFNKETPKKVAELKPKKEEKKETHSKETRRSDPQLTSPKLSIEEVITPNASADLNDPTVKVEHLSSLPRRVLFTVGGLLYAGQLTEVTPPDLYSVTLDKERGQKPHILATEQILTDTMLELKCEDISLPVGTRLCAYWSQQYRCLYPGTVYEPASPTDPFISVEFDDGDNGRINRTDVRLLPKDYPISECDPNPLHGIGQRKRNNSSASTDSHPKTDSSNVDSLPVLSPQESLPPKFIQQPKLKEEEKENENINEDKKKKADNVSKVDNEEERRRLKKKKKMELKKLLANESVWQDLLKYKRKHRELYKMRHKHKHKHRHRKHKHKRSRSCGERLPSEPEPIKPLIVKVHNLPPPEPESKQKVVDETKQEDAVNIVENKELNVNSKEVNTETATTKSPPKKGKKERQASIESKSKMAVFLPARQLWTWYGKGFKRGKGPSPRARKKIFYKSIKRQDEIISVGDCAVFLSTGRPDRPYIGKIEQMWECWGSTMLVRVSWFYHPEETIPKTTSLPFPGGLFESPHVDENDVQTISHKCDVLSFQDFKAKMAICPELATNVYDNNDTYYLAGSYDPTHSNLTLLPQVKQL